MLSQVLLSQDSGQRACPTHDPHEGQDTGGDGSLRPPVGPAWWQTVSARDVHASRPRRKYSPSVTFYQGRRTALPQKALDVQTD